MELVATEMSSIVAEIVGATLGRYPRLRDETEGISMQRIRECEVETISHVALFFRMELSYINVNHKDFLGFDGLVFSVAFFSSSGFQRLSRRSSAADSEESSHSQRVAIHWHIWVRTYLVVLFFDPTTDLLEHSRTKSSGLS